MIGLGSNKNVFSSQYCYEMGTSGFKTKGRLLRLLMDLISSETGRRQIIIKFVNSRRLATASSHKTRIRKINSVGEVEVEKPIVPFVMIVSCQPSPSQISFDNESAGRANYKYATQQRNPLDMS